MVSPDFHVSKLFVVNNLVMMYVQFKAEYIGDLRPNQRALGLSYKILLAPDLESYNGDPEQIPSMANVSKIYTINYLSTLLIK